MSVEGIFRNLPVALVFLTMMAFSWIFGGAQAAPLKPVVPWLLAFLFEVMLFFPQRRPYEDSVSARRRVWWRLGHDPLLYVSLVFLFVLLAPFLNVGLCPVCDRAAIAAGADPNGQIPFLPFCVDVAEHYGVVQWFVPVFAATLAARNALSRQGRRMLLEMMVWNSALLAVLGFVQQATGATSPYWGEEDMKGFFSVFGYPNMGGSFFTMAFAFSVGIWQTRVREMSEAPAVVETAGGKREQGLVRWIKAHYALAAAALNFFAAMATLSRAAVSLVSILALVAFAYHEVWLLLSRHDRVRRVKRAAFAAGGGLLFLLLVFVFAPADMSREMDTMSSRGVLDRVSGKCQYHTRVATEIFKANPVFGVGGWGYRHLCGSYMTKEEFRHGQTEGGANVHNDYMQFLCEHGAVGALCLLLAVLALVYPLAGAWCRLYRTARFMKPENAPPAPRALYCVPPAVVWTVLGNVAVLVHAFGDCPLRSAAVLSSLFVSLACAEGFLPREAKEASK